MVRLRGTAHPDPVRRTDRSGASPWVLNQVLWSDPGLARPKRPGRAHIEPHRCTRALEHACSVADVRRTRCSKRSCTRHRSARTGWYDAASSTISTGQAIVPSCWSPRPPASGRPPCWPSGWRPVRCRGPRPGSPWTPRTRTRSGSGPTWPRRSSEPAARWGLTRPRSWRRTPARSRPGCCPGCSRRWRRCRRTSSSCSTTSTSCVSRRATTRWRSWSSTSHLSVTS